MLPYLLVFALFAVQAIRSAYNPGQSTRNWMLVAGGILIIMVGFRREVGYDWYNYLYIYNYIADVDVWTALRRTEPGYAALNRIASTIGVGIWLPNLICASIFVWGLITFCRQQPNPPLALVVALAYFVIVVGMAYTRQSAALGLVMIAIVQYERGATLRMMIFLALALTFHTSAIVMAPVLAIASAKRGFVPILLISLIAAVLAYQFLGYLMQIVSRYTAETFVSAGAMPRILMNLLPALIFLMIPQRLTRNDAERRLWTTVSVLALVSALALFAGISTTVVDRLGLYVIPLQIVIWSRLPTVLGSRTKPSMLVLMAIIAYSLAVQVVWLGYGHMRSGWLPYRNYLWDSGTGRIPPRWYREAS